MQAGDQPVTLYISKLVNRDDPRQIRYDHATDLGATGAPVFDLETKKIFAIHIASAADFTRPGRRIGLGYSLPMALTGTLSSETAGRRVNETASFFATTVLPGALERHGEGFKAAAMVRLMHSMVRFNAIRSGRWDAKVYGVPIPQVDQMGAALPVAYRLAQYAIARRCRAATRRRRTWGARVF